MGRQGPGDPLTPGFPSVDGIYRNPLNKSGLPTIPAMAMSYGDAKEILRRMKGKTCTFPEVNVHKQILPHHDKQHFFHLMRTLRAATVFFPNCFVAD